MTIRVLVADDNAALRAGLRAIFDAEEGVHVVAEAGDGAEAIERARRGDIDVALVDVRMPGTDGIAATRVLTSERRCDVIVLTTFDLDEYVVSALRAGAVGFLLKTTAADRIVEAVRAVAAGDGVLSPEVTRTLLRTLAEPVPAVSEPAGLADLTDREREVLDCLGNGLSNADIARELVISETTVKSHVSRVMSKLDVRSRLQAAVFARQGSPPPAPSRVHE